MLVAEITNSAQFQLGASDSPTFQLLGGRYAIQVVGTFAGGSIDFKVLGPDGATFLSCLLSPFVSNDVSLVDLPPGTFKFTITNVTNAFASIYPVR